MALSSVRKILVVPLRYIGDTILTVPLIRNLRRQFPEADIDVLVSKTSAALLEPCPYVNQVLIEPKKTSDRLQLLSKGGYDAAFILRKSVTMAVMCRMAGIRTLIGYDKQRWFEPIGYKRWGLFLDFRGRYPSLKTETPQPVSHLGLLEACGLPVHDTHLELWTTPEDETKVSAILDTAGVVIDRPMAVIHTVSASHGKSIEIEKFVAPVQNLAQRGFQILCTGVESDSGLYDRLAVRSGVPLMNLAGKTTLRETVALYRKIRMIVTVDSSPIHLAAAAGVPEIVGVFGPTNEKQWGPYSTQSRFQPVYIDLPCRPCYAKICEHNSCRVQLTGAQISDAITALAASNQ